MKKKKYITPSAEVKTLCLQERFLLPISGDSSVDDGYAKPEVSSNTDSEEFGW